MSNRPPRPPSGWSWGQARWSDPPTSPSQATQAQDAFNQELPAGLPTLAIDVNNSHSCCGMIKGPHAPQWTTLGSGPQGRFSNPSESGPGYPQPGEAHRARAEVAHRPSVRLGCASIKSVPHVSSPSGSLAVSAHALRAIRVSSGSVPRGSQALSTPCRRSLLPGLLGLLCSGRPSLLLLTSESLRPRFVLSSESLSATPTCVKRNSTDIGRVAASD
jgi:hypothetical protein